MLAVAIVATFSQCTNGGPAKPPPPATVHASDIGGLQLPANDATNSVCNLVRINYLNDKLFTADAKTAIRIAAGRDGVDANVKSAVTALYQAASGAPRNRAYETVIKACRDAGWAER